MKVKIAQVGALLPFTASVTKGKPFRSGILKPHRLGCVTGRKDVEHEKTNFDVYLEELLFEAELPRAGMRVAETAPLYGIRSKVSK
jgi:hypothetical protein